MVNEQINISNGVSAIMSEGIAKNLLDENAATLVNEINWFTKVVNNRLNNYFVKEDKDSNVQKRQNGIKGIIDSIFGKTPKEKVSAEEKTDLQSPDITGDNSVYADFVKYYGLNASERLLLILALIPYLQPQLLDVFFFLQ